MVAIILWRLIVTMVSRAFILAGIFALLVIGANHIRHTATQAGYAKGWEDAVKACRAAPIDLNFACVERVTHET